MAAPTVAQAANSDIGLPSFSGDENPVPDTDVGFHPASQLKKIYDRDKAKGAGRDTDHDFWIDKMLARTGTTPTGENGDGNADLFTRGRALFMKKHEAGTLGFGGEVAYWESLAGDKGAYTLDVEIDGKAVKLKEETKQRKQTPSYFTTVFTSADAGLQVRETKYITQNNVAVTQLSVSAADGKRKTITVKGTSSFAKQADGKELTGAVAAKNDITTVHPRLSGDGFAPKAGSLQRELKVPAKGSADTKIQMGFVTDEIPDSLKEYKTYRTASASSAYRKHVSVYNKWWAENIPYLDTPEDNIDKTLFYRWWLLRFNLLDADVPGNDFQFPTSVEGALGYNNAIDLTIGMFVDDLKYVRDPSYSYGTWLSAGETAGEKGQYRDNPGDPENWDTSHTQYISESAWQSYQVHGGPSTVAKQIGDYATRDTEGELATLDSNDNGLLDTNWNAWTGNDGDAVSFDYKPGKKLDRPESAYVYSGAKAGAEALKSAGDSKGAKALEAQAEKVKSAVLKNLWDPKSKQLLSRTTDGDLVPWREINNYYPFSVGLMPKPGDKDYDDDYVKAFEPFKDDEQFPVFPFYTANQADKAEATEAGRPGSNNFSVINSTVTFRMLSSVLRDYPTDAVDAQWYKKLLYWNAWAHYQNNGDNRYPDQNEFWSKGSADPQKIDYRSWIHHTQLGTTNWTMIEDAMGLRPRTDEKLELDPIDIKWDHFAADNLSYHGKDLTITWDKPGGKRYYGKSVPEGYSAFLDGKLLFTSDTLSKVVYDPSTGKVKAEDGAKVKAYKSNKLKAAKDVSYGSDDRVTSLLSRAGVSAGKRDAEAENVADGAKASSSFAAKGHAAEAATDGTTRMTSYWGTAGSSNDTDSLTVDVSKDGAAVPVDTIRTYFYRSSSSSTDSGYASPAQYQLEYDDGSGFKALPRQSRTPAYPQGNENVVRFPKVKAEKIRLTAQHAAGKKTAVKELQAFAAGGSRGAVTKATPQAKAWEDSSHQQQGSAKLLGTVKGTGTTSEPVTSDWSVVSAPEGGKATFASPSSPTSVVRFSEAGSYTLRLTAKQGKKTSHTDVVVQGTELDDNDVNVAGSAKPSADFTADWNNVKAVNDGKEAFFTGGDQKNLWGTYTGDEPAKRWLQYDFGGEVRVDHASIDFWHDSTEGGSGVAVPKSWKLQYWDASAGDGKGGWKDLKNASKYPVEAKKMNSVKFDPVTTTKLRATFTAASDSSGKKHSAVGVSEWRVFAAKATGVDPVHVRTETGKLPTLPTSVDLTYADGQRVAASVDWDEVSADAVKSDGEVEVHGTVAGTTLEATATVWVRSQQGSTITTVLPVEAETQTGNAPQLPKAVTVQYNDGTRATGSKVTWEKIDPDDYAKAGSFEVKGSVEGTDTAAKATVTVSDREQEEDGTD